MAEAWEQLGFLQSKRQGCMDDAQQIRLSCTQDHEKETLVECDECYGKLIEGLRSRYLDSSDAEWFSGRRAFLQELEALFSAAKRYEVDPRDIDARIQTEKRKWYQESVGSTANRLIVDDITSRDDILDRLYEQHLILEDLVKEVREAMSRVAPPPSDVEDLLQRIISAKDPLDRLEVYKEAFFLDGKEGQSMQEGGEPYLDLLKNGMSMEQVAGRILEARQASAGARVQKEKHIRRLDELRRGRTAHELQKTKKKTKSRETFPETQVPEEMYDLPPCAVCSTTVDTDDFLTCCLCQVLVDLGVQAKPTVYCSDDCHARGYDAHTEQAHPCASGEQCILLSDEDVDMDADNADAYLCRECFSSLETPSVFCSTRCAESSFQTHREQVHVPIREKLGIVVDDSSSLVYDDEAQSKYHAADITEHLVSLGEMLQAFEKNNGINVSIVS